MFKDFSPNSSTTGVLKLSKKMAKLIAWDKISIARTTPEALTLNAM